MFETWSEDVEARQLLGVARRYDRDRRGSGVAERIRLPVDSVALLEVTRDELDAGRGVGLTLLASYTVFTGVVAAACLASPKACFGSCPTFYLDGEEGTERLVAEGFSSSVARSLEATDVDDIRSRVEGGRISIRMRNEALETHAVRTIRLHAVAEAEGERVFQTPEGGFRTAAETFEPTRCTAPEGDCLELLRSLDGLERRSLTDPVDLAARETIELEFPSDRGQFGLVVAARHSFVSTFLFYQMLAYLGRDAGPFLAALERGDEVLIERVQDVMNRAGRLEVELMDAAGEWRSIGSLGEAGPLAVDVQLMELPPAPAQDGPIRVRLNLTKGFWRLEHVGLVRIVEEAESLVLNPVGVESLEGALPEEARQREGSRALEALLDPDRYLVTQPGDHFRIDFQVPTPPSSLRNGLHYRLFLESAGYYYEWMRSEWMEEESPERAAVMLLQPEVAFQELAPRFKELEPRMEEAFWNSRFRR